VLLKQPKKLLLVSKTSIPSAKILRDALEGVSGVRLAVTCHEDAKGDFLIRYGNSSPIPNQSPEHNSMEFIRTISNKLGFSRLMKENGIFSPEYYSSGQPTSFPIVIRQCMNSFGGKGIVIVNNKEEFDKAWRNGFHWTPFVAMTKEYRVHVLGGEMKKIFVKKKEGESPTPIRNLENGYHFAIKAIDSGAGYKKLGNLVEKLASFIPGSFYALDIGWCNTKEEYFVLEANSAPGLNENTAHTYAEYLHSRGVV
jgi:hypothetical protein